MAIGFFDLVPTPASLMCGRVFCLVWMIAVNAVLIMENRMMRFDFGRQENGSECPEQTTLTAILRLIRRTTLYEIGR